MRVAFVFLHPFSESMGSVVRVRELSLSLEKCGVEAYIITPYERSFDLSSGVHVVSMSDLVNAAGLSRVLYRLTRFFYYNKAFPNLFSKNELQSNMIMVKIVRRIAKLLVNKDIDIVQVEQDVALPIGVALRRETKLPLVVDLHNISSEELVAAGVLEKGGGEFLALQERTKGYLAEADRVVVVSECMQDYVVDNYGLKVSDVCVVPPGGRCGVDKAVAERRVKPVKVVYGGLVAYREHVDLFVRSMPFVVEGDEGVQFYITNKGEAVGEVKKLARGLGVNPVFFWYDSYETANKFLSSCHVGVLPSSNDVARRMGTPAKLFNYMSVGLPVVANDIGGWTEIIRKERVGLVTSDDPRDFGEALVSVANDPKAMLEYAFNGLELIKTKYNWDNSALTLLATYMDLTSKN
jgi:glycosyltransferase involved in cell wall biosynthesis